MAVAYETDYAVAKSIAWSSPRYRKLSTQSWGILDLTWKALCEDSQGSHPVVIDGYEVQAHRMKSLDWLFIQRLCNMAERFDEDARNEGYKYTFDLVSSLEHVTLPRCDCRARGVEISDSVSVRGNRFNSNSDTYGTQLGLKAHSVYVFWVEDLNRYGLVYESYWLV